MSERSAPLTIATLGGLDIRLAGAPLAGLASRKAEALLVYLACAPGPHPRELLADLLWDDLPAERGRGNLSVLLSSLRQLGGYIQAGIVSWGLSASAGQGCEETALFSAYTNISKFVPWLNQTIEANP